MCTGITVFGLWMLGMLIVRDHVNGR